MGHSVSEKVVAAKSEHVGRSCEKAAGPSTVHPACDHQNLYGRAAAILRQAKKKSYSKLGFYNKKIQKFTFNYM